MPLPFDIGFPELLMVLLVSMLVIGPERLPDLARRGGATLREIRRVTSGMTETMNQQFALADVYRLSPSGLRRGCIRCGFVNPEDTNFCERCQAGLFAEDPSALANHAL